VDAYGESNASKPLISFAVVDAIASVAAMYLKEMSKQELEVSMGDCQETGGAGALWWAAIGHRLAHP
jgi:hypothetical protein